MNNFEIVIDLIAHIQTKDQLALFVLQMIQQGKKYHLDNIDMVNQWLQSEAEEE